MDAIRPEKQHQHNLGDTQGNRTPEIGTRFPLTDHHIGKQRIKRHHRTAHAQHTQQFCTRLPFLGQRDDDKLIGNESQSEQQRERKEADKPDHLSESHQLALPVVREIYQGRLDHRIQHSLQQEITLRVPLISLVVATRNGIGIETAQQDIHHIVVDFGGDGCGSYLEAERKHRLHGREIYLQRRSPSGIMPYQQGIQSHIDHSLGCQ